MKTSLKAGFAQIFSCCPKNLSCPKFGGAAAPLAPPGPYAYEARDLVKICFEGRRPCVPFKTARLHPGSMLHSLSKDTAFKGETAPRHIFL